MNFNNFNKKQLGVIALIVAVFGGVYVTKNKIMKKPEAKPAISLASVVVQKGMIAEKKIFSGTLQPEKEMEIILDKPATIKKIRQDGEFVKKGEIIVEFENSAETSALYSAEAVMISQEAEYKRALGLKKDYLISEAELQTKESSWKKSKADYQRAEFELSKMTVKAPFDGYMGIVGKSEGSILTHNNKAASFVSDGPLSVTFYVSEREAAKIKEGDDVDVYPDIDNALPVEAAITAYEPKSDSTHNVLVKAKFKESNKELIPGQFVRVHYAVGVKHDVLIVPEAAVRTSHGSSNVFVVHTNGSLAYTPVKIGIRNEGKVEIVDGLKEGQIVIVESGDSLSDGMKVKPQIVGENKN